MLRPLVRLPRLAAAPFLIAACASVVAFAQAPTEKGRLGLSLARITTPWTGDLEGMTERRLVRVLTTFSKTQYFIDRGTPRGTAYDQGKLLEDELNKARPPDSRVSVQFVPLSRSELLPALLDGKGDIVMADLTVTPERQATVAFTDPWIDGVDEIVVTSPGAPPIPRVTPVPGTMGIIRCRVPVLVKTWMRSSARSHTYTRPSLPMVMQCGWPPSPEANKPGESVTTFTVPATPPHCRSHVPDALNTTTR